ncbi:hypothetical protein DERP_014396 [Dermatophagoides pteronyssinus]|uniref:Uncharacterized protein n=1 Tax=Dermatophagoides pteronyssinus TaxID=6956 RepID=A0ABQ8J5Y2_DERPT|nr:hypothetical protein DERP_014396 [Dermatophagoides pteronyssinus]
MIEINNLLYLHIELNFIDLKQNVEKAFYTPFHEKKVLGRKEEEFFLRIGESLKSINFQLCRHLPKGMKRLFRNVEFQLLKNLILNGYLL